MVTAKPPDFFRNNFLIWDTPIPFLGQSRRYSTHVSHVSQPHVVDIGRYSTHVSHVSQPHVSDTNH